ncbi:MAG: hypothetical protein IJ136_09305 [Erysipelotrichaceae bacterium]|nr:hypothetical protein [Erysipelotrichaceae bacterium]
MEKEIVKKNFLNADDVSVIFGCSKSKSYQIINEVNNGLAKEGVRTFSGKVLASALYKWFGLDRYLFEYENA